MIVSELAKRCGVPSHVVRYYSRIGLLTPVRNPDNGYKVFNKNDAGRIQFIRKAQSIGFTLDEIQNILSIGEEGFSPCSKVRQGLKQHLEENHRQMEELRNKRRRMEQALALWNDVPDQDSGVESICHLIDRVAI